jgi:two-component system cell cycle response regulator
VLPRDEDEPAARHALAQLALVLGRCVALDERHKRLQKLAITDDLTGVYNARWFRHFLDRILEKARQKRFPVTLLLFDIDNFKRYNDTYGHGVGDEILRQTATLMRRCCRDHDLVARISGDEFAVVFWDNEPPRVPRDPSAVAPSRVPQTPLQIADRFRRLLQSKEFTALGPQGQGKLTISGGLAVYPYDAQTPHDLIQAADRALMFGAKKGGKNSVFLVGDEPDEAINPT